MEGPRKATRMFEVGTIPGFLANFSTDIWRNCMATQRLLARDELGHCGLLCVYLFARGSGLRSHSYYPSFDPSQLITRSSVKWLM